MDDEFLITIKIAERHVFQLRIKRAEEEIMRKAASEIERKIRQYRQRFSAEAKLDTDERNGRLFEEIRYKDLGKISALQVRQEPYVVVLFLYLYIW